MPPLFFFFKLHFFPFDLLHLSLYLFPTEFADSYTKNGKQECNEWR